MSDEEEDYLSDKFLASLESSKPPATGNASYAERRRIAQRESERKRLEGRIKSRRELEEEARREGLSRSLFEKEKDAEQQGSGGEKEPKLKSEEPPEPGDEKEEVEEGGKKLKSGHLTEPLPLAMWAGRKGLGLGKPEEDAAEKSRNENFRSQARGEYEEKRNEGRLRAALRTRATLDEAQGIQFNVLQLNPTDPSSVPPALYDLLTRTSFDGLEEAPLAAKPGSRVLLGESDFDEDVGPGADRAVAARLKEQMKADSLRPLEETLDEDKTLAMKDALQEEAAPKEGSTVNDQPDFDEDTVDAAREYLQRNVQERLDTLLQYLRSKYHIASGAEQGTTARRIWSKTALG
ncbi:G-patch domain-containing protein [Ceratobasidium sp. AG-Ba]|nr:G-patch domain-containing protein [Ceratobasidium sp. AG-Ba]